MIIIENPPKENWDKILERPTLTAETVEQTVNQIFDDVKRQGDKAIKKYTDLFDGAKLSTNLVSDSEIQNAIANISTELKNAIQLAKKNIEQFHKAQRTEPVNIMTMPGVNCWQDKRPIEKIGLYIPGGTAPLFSTVLMLAIPAKIAGVKDIVLCSPPNAKGKIANEILYTANLCGINNIIKVGGIQAIAGMTFGTQSIPKVYKIFGPGNQFVTVAKQAATKFGVAIDMPAGPSELLVMGDDSASPAFVASDLLSQAEHGADSQVILVSTSKKLLTSVSEELVIQIKELPRAEIAKKAMKHSKLIYLKNDKEAIELINEYGPEHLIVNTSNPEFYLENINNVGSVFIGNYTPESAGDYASGTNHTLPTNGYSKAYSGVNLDSFLKSITFQKITKDGLQRIGPSIELMAKAEGLEAHKNAISIRLNNIKNEN